MVYLPIKAPSTRGLSPQVIIGVGSSEQRASSLSNSGEFLSDVPDVR